MKLRKLIKIKRLQKQYVERKKKETQQEFGPETLEGYGGWPYPW